VSDCWQSSIIPWQLEPLSHVTIVDYGGVFSAVPYTAVIDLVFLNVTEGLAVASDRSSTQWTEAVTCARGMDFEIGWIRRNFSVRLHRGTCSLSKQRLLRSGDHRTFDSNKRQGSSNRPAPKT
jgi:hypothetical protein